MQDEASAFVVGALDVQARPPGARRVRGPGWQDGASRLRRGRRRSRRRRRPPSAAGGAGGEDGGAARRHAAGARARRHDARALRDVRPRAGGRAVLGARLGAPPSRAAVACRPRSELSRLARLQVAITTASAELLRPGGRLVYSVCTFPRAETDAACDAILRHRPDLVPADVTAPDGSVAPRVRLWPHRQGCDAMFVAAFTKRAGGEAVDAAGTIRAVGMLAASILSADLAHLADQVKLVEGYADIIHIDIMDGHFVPPIALGTVVVASLRPCTDRTLHGHLMVDRPESFFEELARGRARHGVLPPRGRRRSRRRRREGAGGRAQRRRHDQSGDAGRRRVPLPRPARRRDADEHPPGLVRSDAEPGGLPAPGGDPQRGRPPRTRRSRSRSTVA